MWNPRQSVPLTGQRIRQANMQSLNCFLRATLQTDNLISRAFYRRDWQNGKRTLSLFGGVSIHCHHWKCPTPSVVWMLISMAGVKKSIINPAQRRLSLDILHRFRAGVESRIKYLVKSSQAKVKKGSTYKSLLITVVSTLVCEPRNTVKVFRKSVRHDFELVNNITSCQLECSWALEMFPLIKCKCSVAKSWFVL